MLKEIDLSVMVQFGKNPKHLVIPSQFSARNLFLL